MRRETINWLAQAAEERETCGWCLGHYLNVDPEADVAIVCNKCHDGKVLKNPHLYEIMQELDYLQSEVKRLSDGMGP